MGTRDVTSLSLVSKLVKRERWGSLLLPRVDKNPPLSGKLPQILQQSRACQQPSAIMEVKSTLIMCLCSPCYSCRFLSSGQHGALLPVFQPSGMT